MNKIHFLIKSATPDGSPGPLMEITKHFTERVVVGDDLTITLSTSNVRVTRCHFNVDIPYNMIAVVEVFGADIDHEILEAEGWKVAE